MSLRAAACRLAGRGLRVFRLRAGTKGGAGNYIDSDWTTTATSDPMDVYEMWTAADGSEAPYNIGVLATGLAVLDVDDKGAKRGSDELARIVSEIGALPGTYTVETPTGGRHIYFRGDGYGQRDAADGINVRATNGYVVGAGSIVGGKAYREIDAAPIAEIPPALGERLRAARVKDRKAGETVGTLDLPQAIAAANSYIEREAPTAIEGSNGDQTTFRVACRLLDYGLTHEAAFELLVAWNERCEPAWALDDLEKKLQNAAAYRRQAIGAENPVEGFEPYVDEPAANPLDALVSFPALSAADIDALPPRPWVSKGHLMRGKLTTVVAPGSAGKSLLTLQWAVALASGVGSFVGLPMEAAPYTVLMINGEDEQSEQRLRLGAVAKHYGFDLTEFAHRLGLLSVSDHPLTLVRKQGQRGAVQLTESLGHLEDYITRKGVDVLFVDPLIEVHEVEENSNSEMRIVMQALRGIAARTNCAVCLVHHTAKPAGSSSDGHTGNHSAGRGASAVSNAARINFTLFPMSEKDAELLEVLPADRKRYVRLDDAKMNHSLESAFATWFEKVSVEVGAGRESIGVLKPWQPHSATGKTRQYIAELLADHVRHEPLTLKAAARIVAEDRMFAGQALTGLSKRLRDMFSGAAVAVGGRQIIFEPDGATGGTLSTRALVS